MQPHIAAIAVGIGVLTAGCATPPPASGGYLPGLGEIMAQIAMHHGKLWFAGAAGNWQLADYEIHELAEGFAQAGTLHPLLENVTERVPALLAGNVQQPLARLQQAVAAGNPQQFTAGYQALTEGCNTCHRSAGFAFNRITIPAFNPYSNQNFNAEDASGASD